MVLIELCRRCVGLPILVVLGLLLIYTFYNQLSWDPSFYKALKNIVYKLFYTTSGVIGTPVSVCYTYIVLFIIFGAFLEATGIANFFIEGANAIAGSASGGLQIALDALADNFIQMSQTSGIPLAVFHRVGSIACGGLDTLPWNGTVVMLFALSGVSYKKGYKHVAMETVILPLLSLIPVFIYYSIVH